MGCECEGLPGKGRGAPVGGGLGSRGCGMCGCVGCGLHISPSVCVCDMWVWETHMCDMRVSLARGLGRGELLGPKCNERAGDESDRPACPLHASIAVLTGEEVRYTQSPPRGMGASSRV